MNLNNLPVTPWQLAVDSTCSGAWFEIRDAEGNEIARTETIAMCEREMKRYYGARTELCAYEFEPEAWEKDEYYDETLAAAHMMIAAPELYDALEESPDPNDYATTKSFKIAYLRWHSVNRVAALAKARGEA